MTVHGKELTQNVFAPNLFSECKEERRASEICCHTQRNVTLFSIAQFLTNYDVINRKHLIVPIYSIVQKGHKERSEKVNVDYSGLDYIFSCFDKLVF